MNEPEEYSIDRPLPVTTLLLFVLCMTTWNGIRAWTTLTNWDILSRFRANPSYIFATGIVWFMIGIVLIILFLKRNRIAPACGLTLSILYLLWYWVDRLVIQAYPAPNIVFSIIVSIILLITFNANLFWPSSQAFFKHPANINKKSGYKESE